MGNLVQYCSAFVGTECVKFDQSKVYTITMINGKKTQKKIHDRATAATTIISSSISTLPSTSKLCTEEISKSKKIARSSRFTPSEDTAMCKHWRVSKDAVTRYEQNREVFYKAIHSLYETLKQSYCQWRHIKSTIRHDKKILLECLAFSGCVSKVQNAL